jgi:hypothetical protein
MSTVSGWNLATFQRKYMLPSSGRLQKWKNRPWWVSWGLVSMPFLITPENGGTSILWNLDWDFLQCPEFCNHYSGLFGLLHFFYSLVAPCPQHPVMVFPKCERWRIFVESLFCAYSTEVGLSLAFGSLILYCQYHWHRDLANLWDENHNNI